MTRNISYPSPHFRASAESTITRREDMNRGTTWPEQEVEWLIQHYGKFRVRFIAEQLRRSEQSVRIKIHRLRKQRSDRKENVGNVSRLTFRELYKRTMANG
jgi:hypothetical protein